LWAFLLNARQKRDGRASYEDVSRSRGHGPDLGSETGYQVPLGALTDKLIFAA
jgi:hypothetical protein